MKLVTLLNGVRITDAPNDAPMEKNIADICYDSRRATESCLFVCLRGSHSDGHKYALSAYEKGCRFFVAETTLTDLPSDACVFLCPDTRRALAILSANLFEHPSEELFVIGITGTKGKTTTALMICHALNAAGMPCGYIGSNGIDCGDFHADAVNTTPESYITQMYMRHMCMAGVRYLVMEVSSQALYMSRVHGIRFDTVVFTNLSPDHIGGNEHPTFEHYKDCKKTLFSDFGAKAVILNADDPYCAEMESAVPHGTSILHYALHRDAEFCAKPPTLYRGRDSLGICFELTAEGKGHTASLPFPGEFSVYNALAAIAVCRVCGIPTERAIDLLSDARIGGRFEMINAMDGVTFVIDYAHNKVSMTAALETLRRYNPARLICLFGSVGGRTFGRRRELGEAASSLADFCILTSDNPDFEEPMDILNDIAAAFEGTSCPYQIIPDRADAIRYAVSMARKGDIFLFAGKGHETYQLINGQKTPFSEKDILLEACKDKKPQEV